MIQEVGYMNSKEYCTEALESKCVHTRYRLDVFIQLIQLAKPSPALLFPYRIRQIFADVGRRLTHAPW